jgi:hypothetical protein
MGTPGGGQRVYDMCALALKVRPLRSALMALTARPPLPQNGYRHFDTASGYRAPAVPIPVAFL